MAKALGKTLYVKNYDIKGCYSYATGKYVNNVYYGTKGRTWEMRLSLALPQYRPSGYDCKTYGILYFNIFLRHALNSYIYIYIYLFSINETFIFNKGGANEGNANESLTTGK